MQVAAAPVLHAAHVRGIGVISPLPMLPAVLAGETARGPRVPSRHRPTSGTSPIAALSRPDTDAGAIQP